MYNPNKIYELLRERGIKNKDFLEALGKQWNGSVRQVIEGQIRVDKLEAIADFFGVPTDMFFDRKPGALSGCDNNGVWVDGRGHRLKNIQVGCLSDTHSLEILLAEKDKRIANLEDTIAILKATQGIQTPQTNLGQ